MRRMMICFISFLMINLTSQARDKKTGEITNYLEKTEQKKTVSFSDKNDVRMFYDSFSSMSLGKERKRHYAGDDRATFSDSRNVGFSGSKVDRLYSYQGSKESEKNKSSSNSYSTTKK
ncbi:hypothetical protein TUBRATIS_13750 [Tubulinosema ratisbonensis]|uniref:Uncharacterized protein n=1 Tax=Tubulinosema ratisbonensis TaxID=291195 RepID=A0A437AM33_9MICR|nr:hypothetical protein TUBRATIS_13750 [Tubulinosema ratisbonensis]